MPWVTKDGLDKRDLLFDAKGEYLYFTQQVTVSQLALVRMNMANGTIERLHPDAKDNEFGLALSRDETHRVYMHNAGDLNLRVVITDLKDVQLGEVRFGGFSMLYSPTFTPDGQRVIYSHADKERQQIVSVDLTGGDPKMHTDSGGINSFPTYSPDGKSILFQSTRDGSFDIYTMDADGGNVRRLTDRAAIDYHPRWSPDGKSVVFTSNRDGNFELYQMDADGTNERRLTHNPEADDYAAFHPDGKRIYYVTEHDSRHDIAVIDLTKLPK